jgi:hypothetical protein
VSDSNLFDAIVTGSDVERAVALTLGSAQIAAGAGDPYFIDTYLAELERLQGYDVGSIERPHGIVTSSEFDKWPEDSLPIYLVLCVGLAGQPMRNGDSSWEARWGVGVGAVVSDVDPVLGSSLASRKLAQAHAAAIRATLLQHKSLGGFAENVVWVDETYGDLPFDDQRTLGAGRVTFEVIVTSTVREHAGPRAPLPTPTTEPPSDPLVTAATVTAEPTPITEAVH